jgi:peptidoglycan hydrolase-like protein with peptidoglycan-binding domain
MPKKIWLPLLITLMILVTAPDVQAENCRCPNETLPNLHLTSPYIKDESVAYLQARLLEHDFDPGPIDGIYGPRTHQALQSYAQNRNLDPEAVPVLWLTLTNKPTAAPASPLEPGKVQIAIDLAAHKLVVYHDGESYREYPVAVGTSKTPSPVGEWQVVHKSLNWGTGFGTRWLGLNVPWGIYGIHGTNKPWSIGTNASHGCIRMFNRDVEELYTLVPRGTPVRIHDSRIDDISQKVGRRTIKIGSSGQDVVYVQELLKQKGYYLGYADGRYGRMTALAVKYLQLLHGYPSTGVVDEDTYKLLESTAPTAAKDR